MATGRRASPRFSDVETDSTIRDIWQYSQKQGASFDPQAMNEEVDIRRQVRKEARPGDGLGFDDWQLGESPAIREDIQSRALKKRRSTNINLQRSLQLLDEAVGTPGPLLKSGRKTPGILRHSAYTPKPAAAPPRFDMSSSFGMATPGRSIIATPASNLAASFGESAVNMSNVPITPMRASGVEVGQSVLDDDVTTTNVALLLEEDPGLAASSGLFGEFLEGYKASPSEHQVFHMLAQYEQLSGDQVNLLKKLVKRTTPGQAKFIKTHTVLDLLEQERCTWRLLSSLYKDRLETELKGEEEEAMMTDMLVHGKRLTEQDIVNGLYEKNSNHRQAQLVIDWLEKTAEEQLENYYDRVEFFTDQAGTWENTLYMLQQQASDVPSHTDRPIVDKLDPDAPIRQRRPLADLDQEDDSRLLKYLFACIRAGQLAEAQRLCTKCGQAWRAATLEGWRLYHDPNYEGSRSGGPIRPVQGNQYRDIWKVVCWRMAEENQFHPYEKAIYATLSGNIKHLLPVCRSWEDYVWAYFKAMVDTRVEQEIRMNPTHERTFEQLPPSFWDKRMSMDSIFMDIEASPNEDVRQQARHQFHIIQKFIMLGDIDGLIEELYEWVKDELSPLHPHLLRFMAHLLLFFRTIGVISKEELCVAVLETYVRQLMEARQVNLVATYTATLPHDLQLECYAKFLESIEDSEERQHCLGLAADAGLDIPSITKLVVENIRNRDTGDMGMDNEGLLENATNDDDRQKIEAIDWLVFDPTQRSEAMRQANAVMRTFLAMRKHSAARDVFRKIPAGSIDVIMKNWHAQTGSTELSAEDDNAIREYLCTQAYLDAQDSFNDWFEHYHHAKPVRPPVQAGANFTERVAYEHKVKQYEAELERWQHALLLQTKTTKERIYNVLLFVDGGWLVDQRRDGREDETRSHQMAALRQLCLPTLCFLLQTVLATTGQHRECVQFADIIASEQHQLYKVFNRDEVQKFLQKLRESSICLLDKNLDPLGYELV